jgi:cytochrome P450
MDDAAYLEKTLSTAVQEIRGACAASINGALSVLFQSLGLPEFQPFMVPAAQRRALRELFEWIDDKIHWSHVDATTSPLLESLEHRYGDRTRGARRRLIVAEYAMLLTAGIETTAAALTFAIAEIAASPAIRDAAAAEARSSAADIERTGTLPEQFPYLHAILRETLRRHTLVPTMLREAQADCELSARRPGGAGRDLVKIKCDALSGARRIGSTPHASRRP